MTPALGLAAGDHRRQLRGVFGDDIDGLLEVPVARRPRHADVARGRWDQRRVVQAAQHQDRLGPAGRRALPRPGIVVPAVLREPADHGVEQVIGDVESGTIGDHVGSLRAVRSLVVSDFSPGTPRPSARHARHQALSRSAAQPPVKPRNSW